MGILADHVPTIAQLNPGLLEVVSAEKTTKFFGTLLFFLFLPFIPTNVRLFLFLIFSFWWVCYHQP
jgi:hypothetical protein